MNLEIKTIYAFLLLIILTVFSSCIGQNAPKAVSDQTSQNREEVNALGKSVAALDKGVMVIFQDQQNNYWFGGAEQGVYKYDGENLILYSLKDGLCSTSVLGIQEDKSGNIYFDTFDGVSKFDGQQFTTLTVKESSSTSKAEWKLEPDDLWFRIGWNKNGPYRYDGEFLHFLEFPQTEEANKYLTKHPNAPTPYGIYSMYTDSKGAVWFGTASLGACRYDGNTVSWLYEKHLVETSDGGNPGIRSILEDKDGYFWFSNTRYRYEMLPGNTVKGGANYLNYRKEDGIAIAKDNGELDYPYFMAITEDNNGEIWLATYDEGVWQNHGEENKNYKIRDGDKGILLFSIYNDNEGVCWLATHGGGIYKFNGQAFEKFEL